MSTKNTKSTKKFFIGMDLVCRLSIQFRYSAREVNGYSLKSRLQNTHWFFRVFRAFRGYK